MLWNTDFPVFTIFQCEYELRLAHLMWWWIIWNIIIQFKKTIFYCSPAGTETLICLCCDLAKDEPIWMKNVRRKNIFICIWKKDKFYKHSTVSLVLKSIVLMFHYTQLENSSSFALNSVSNHVCYLFQINYCTAV